MAAADLLARATTSSGVGGFGGWKERQIGVLSLNGFGDNGVPAGLGSWMQTDLRVPFSSANQTGCACRRVGELLARASRGVDNDEHFTPRWTPTQNDEAHRQRP
jgi:hypothetical protein